jgi:hypothetical protein
MAKVKISSLLTEGIDSREQPPKKTRPLMISKRKGIG